MNPFTIGIVGATGTVGQTALDLLANKQDLGLEWLGTVRAFASRSSAGKHVSMGTQRLTVEESTPLALAQCQILLFATETALSQNIIPPLAARGILCIDKSAAFRADPKVPLVVPEVNGHCLLAGGFQEFPLVANPNCCATPLVVALFPLHKAYGLKRVIVSTYQSVSGAGKQGIEALWQESQDFLAEPGLAPKGPTFFPKPIAHNVLPFVASIGPNGHTDEEEKICAETQKILGCSLPISATSVRVPTFVGHCLSVSVELDRAATREEVAQLFREAPGLAYTDHLGPDSGTGDGPLDFVTPREAQGTDPVWLSRLRPCGAFEKGFSFWVVADNLRKGAALNALHIVSYLKSQTGFFSR